MRTLSRYLLLVFIFSVPWQNTVVLGGTRTLSSAIAVVALLATVLTCFAEKRIAKPPVFFFAFLMFVTWQLATYFWSVDAASTLGRVLTLVQILAMVWLVVELCPSERERLQLMQAFVFGGIVVCLMLIQAYLSGRAMDTYRFVPRDFNPNESADLIAMGIPMALLGIARGKRGALFWLNTMYVPLGLFSVVLTASRSGFVATCVGLTAVVFVLRRTRSAYRILWLVVSLAVFAGVFFGLSGSQRLQANIQRLTFSRDIGSIGTLTGRTTIWAEGLKVFSAHPLFGIGAGTFRLGVEDELGPGKDAHDMWVEIAAGTGVVGLALLAALLAAALAPVLIWRDESSGFYIVLFLVLLVVASLANVVTSKALWFVLTILSVQAVAGAREGHTTGATRGIGPPLGVELRRRPTVTQSFARQIGRED